MKKIFSLVLLFAATATAMAIPAKPGPIVRTAEDGTEKIIYLHGNEWFHYTTDEQGRWLDETTLKPLTEAQKKARLNEGVAAQTMRRAPQAKEEVGGKPNISPRGLVILVSFSDKEFTTPKATMDSMHNGRNFTRDYTFKYGFTKYHIQSSGSVWQYFHDQSYGAYDPIFDVVGPITLDKEMEYYGKNYGSWTDKNATDMIKEACLIADTAYDIDYAQYDNDNDGLVDFVYIIYAGYGEADSGIENTVWPHQWNLYTKEGVICEVDGKKIDRYACGNEISFKSNQYDGIGTFCHEFSHVLGLPDFYETNNPAKGIHTLSTWDIMDRGCYNNDGNTPPAYSSYERFYMGWLTPRVLGRAEKLSIGKLNADTTALLMCEGDSHNLIGYNPNPTTFYMVENREKTGWDKYLPGKGLLITKITYNANTWLNNAVNNKSNAMGVDIIEAKENTSDAGKYQDTYPAGSVHFTAFPGHELKWIELDANGIIHCKYRWDATPIENVQSDDVQCTKVLKDGQVIIVRGGVSYDMMGRKIDR